MNRSLILFAAMLLTCNLVKAQTEKGDQTLGVDFTLVTDHSNSASPAGESAKYINFDIGPAYSYFIATNWDLAANIDYGSSVDNYTYNNSSNVFGPSKTNAKNYSATLSLRRYFMYKNKIGLRAGVYTGVGHSSNSFTYLPDEQNNNSSSTANFVQGGLNLSLVYYPSKKLGVSLLLANLQYQHYAETSSIQGNSSENSFSVGFKTDNLGLSLFYVFGGKG